MTQLLKHLRLLVLGSFYISIVAIGIFVLGYGINMFVIYLYTSLVFRIVFFSILMLTLSYYVGKKLE